MKFNISDQDFLSIMRKRNFNLPKRWDGKNFHSELSGFYNQYITEVMKYLPETEYKQISTICKSICNTIIKYLEGFIKEAYNYFEEVMETLNSNPLKEYSKTGWKANTLREDPLKLYRVRYIQGNKLLNKRIIFHTPNDLRSKIPTCRFSISGFPSLYLGTCLQLCSEEAAAISFNDNLIASRFEFNRDFSKNGNIEIKVFDLAIRNIDFVYYRGKNGKIRKGFDEINLEDDVVRSNYLLWYPLILGCSFMRTNKSDPFAVEYILPQFLMQWIRSRFADQELIGIRYFSCASERASNMGFNYVFPVSGKWINKGGEFCSVLAKAFKFTEPRYLREFDDIPHLEGKLNNLIAKSFDGH